MAEGQVRDLWREARELGLGISGEVERLESPPSPLVFLRDFVAANKPCIISRAATLHWPAISSSLWSDDSYLFRILDGCDVSVHLTPHGRADSLVPIPPGAPGDAPRGLCFASAFVRTMEFQEALRIIYSTGSPSSPVVAYAQQQNDCFRAEYSALAADVEPHIPWATEALGCLPEAVNLWIGNGRSETSFHKDHYENIYVVVTGEKHFLLLPPTEVHRLYVRSYPAAQYVTSSSSSSKEMGKLKLEMVEPKIFVPWCSVDPYPPSPEAMAEQRSSFPLYFNGLRPFQCTIKSGEILYLPSMWFHHVSQTPDSNGRTIAINYWYDMVFDIKYAYFNFLQSINFSHCTNESTRMMCNSCDISNLSEDSELESTRKG